MPMTAAPSTATRVVRNRVSQMSLAIAVWDMAGPAKATGDAPRCAGGEIGSGSYRTGARLHQSGVSVLVRAVDADEVVDLVVGVDRLAGVAPEPLQHVVRHGAPLHVPVVHVGDLQLAPAGGLQGRDHLEHVGVVEVDAGDGVAGGGAVGLLVDADHAAVAVQLGHAEVGEVGGVVDAGEHDAGAGGLGDEVGDGRPQAPLDDVVGQHH